MRRVVVLIFSILCFTQVQAEDGTPRGIITLDGPEAPSLLLTNMDGEPWDIKKAKGRWLFVHFWASWCGPCRREMPKIQAIFDQFEKSELEFVIINTSETEDTVFSFLASIEMDINPLMDLDGQVTERWQPRGLPSTYLVDPEGRLRYLALGGRPWDTPEYLAFLKGLGQQ